MVVLLHEVPHSQASHTPHICFLITFLPFTIITHGILFLYITYLSQTLSFFPLSESFDSNHQAWTHVHYFTHTTSHPLGYDFTTIMM